MTDKLRKYVLPNIPYYDLKIREIATITKASVSTVKSRLQQGIKKLERYLADFRGGDNV